MELSFIIQYCSCITPPKEGKNCSCFQRLYKCSSFLPLMLHSPHYALQYALYCNLSKVISVTVILESIDLHTCIKLWWKAMLIIKPAYIFDRGIYSQTTTAYWLTFIVYKNYRIKVNSGYTYKILYLICATIFYVM